ncbi:tRNA lysidine(34) synthetase TilS [Enterobacter sp. Cy-643]|uniref:tRNA lysidine(34) synthetase TilS n=1 Tax=Enterobacter sp. Cy-643 TaxID=2608346 RepID=UPI00142211AB|nr:tRNA lysidine(34) synthetase TilS [Enterobacter sp. Cy-643]NIF33094.1 tRNA lysidine(34) synthetase TilS [Enterobacter sp. Cy-643]
MTSRELQSFLHPHRQLLVAFSGGLDSTVLLHQVVTLRDTLQPGLHIRAMHIHHGLSPRADSWVEHCRAICEKWNVPFEVAYVQLPSGGQGIEGEARAARYQALSDSLLAGEVLLTAQHLDDQCETFLLALKRGSGPAGLASMPAILPFSDTLLLRPLLTTSRAQLEEWAGVHRLRWIEDESNRDDKYDRNFLRLRVVPLLQQRWPHFSRSVARSAALCGEQEQLLDELLAEQLDNLMSPEGALHIESMLTMGEARRFALLRRWLSWHRAAMPSRASLQRLWQEVALSREDANPQLRLGEHAVRRFQGELYWVPLLNADRDKNYLWLAPYQPLVLPGLGIISLSEKGMAVRAPAEGEIVSLRFKASGLLHIVGRDKGRTLKKIWQELRIPPWERDATPLLFYGEQLIAAPGIFVTREGQATEHSCWQIDWQKGVEQ